MRQSQHNPDNVVSSETVKTVYRFGKKYNLKKVTVLCREEIGKIHPFGMEMFHRLWAIGLFIAFLIGQPIITMVGFILGVFLAWHIFAKYSKETFYLENRNR